MLTNICYADALNEAEEIGFTNDVSFEDRLAQALEEMIQYQEQNESSPEEVVEEELVYKFDEENGGNNDFLISA